MAVIKPNYSDRAAVVGVGYTDFSMESGRPVVDLAMAAVTAAIADAGLEAHQVDGLLSYHLNDSVPVTTVANRLQIPHLRWHNDIYGGGTQCSSILADAAMSISSGLAETVVVYRALNGRSGKRMGQISLGSSDGNEENFLTPYGFRGPVNLFGLVAQKYMQERELDSSDLVAVITAQRAYAAKNPRALRRETLDEDSYKQSPMIASPLRRADCCMETDAACALVITRADLAERGDKRPVLIHAAARGGGPGCSHMDTAPNLSRIYSHYVAPDLYAHSAIKAEDIELAQLYDGYSFLVLQQLEDFGLCGDMSASQFVKSGATASGGSLPVNTNGGLLCEGYVHGLNNIVEAVLQLQGRAGERQQQVSNALCTGVGASYGSAVILKQG